jgi:hypothetical protein
MKPKQANIFDNDQQPHSEPRREAEPAEVVYQPTQAISVSQSAPLDLDDVMRDYLSGGK